MMAEAPMRPPRARDPPPMTSDETWEQFSQLHDHSYIVTDSALAADDRGMTDQAIEGYQKALDLMDEALAIEANDNEKIINMQTKIRRAKKETLNRLVDAQSAYAATSAPPPCPPPPSAGAQPPSYESLYPSVPAALGQMYPAVPEETSAVSSHLAVRVAAEVEDAQAVALMEIADETNGGCLSLPRDADVIFSLAEGVQMFFVAPDGSVSAPSVPAPLRLCRFHTGETALPSPGSPTAFLQVGDWTYPLIPGCSPVLHSNFGPYMFPDLERPGEQVWAQFPDSSSSTVFIFPSMERPGHHVALLVPDSVSAADRRQFESLLSDLTALVSQPTAEPTPAAPARTKEGTAARVSGGLVKGAEMLSKGLVAGAGKLSQYMTSGTQKLQTHVTPAGPVQLDPRLKSTAQTARKVGVGALKVSEFVVTQVGKGTMALAAYIAPHVKTSGTKLLTSTKAVSDEKEAHSKMDAALEVASGAVRGFGVVYTGLETAASILASSFANNTVTLVETRYGVEAGRVAEDGLHAAGNLAMTGHNVQSLGAKGIAKRVAKDTGKQLIQEHDTKKQGPR